jgi:hypothetical protein
MQPPPLAAQFEDCRMKGKPPKVRQEATPRKGGIEFTNGDEPGVKLRKANGKRMNASFHVRSPDIFVIRGPLTWAPAQVAPLALPEVE